MALIVEDGEEFEVPDEDCEFEEDGSGFWLLAAEGEDEDEFYEYVEDEE
jgi:hypothetical protein